MAKKNETALAAPLSFNIVSRYEGIDPELRAQLLDEMEDLDPESGISCRQIKVPSGGGIAYEVQGDDEDDPDSVKEIEGVIVFTHRVNAYWPGSFGTGGNPEDKVPACSSMDGKTGLNLGTGEMAECERCPYNQYGTGTDDKGNPSRGKACKNMRRIYIMMSDDPNLYLLTVPPTSIKDANKQLARILASGVPYTGMVVTFGLEKAKNSSGVAYSKVIIKKKGALDPSTAARMAQLRGEIKAQYQSVAITMDDYAPAPEQSGSNVDAPAEMDPQVGTPQFDDAPEADPSNIPFV